jgi:cytidine deaminase
VQYLRADELIERAREVAIRAYAPYSKFRVGAAVEDANARLYLGCNVENASYGLTSCAERNAIFAAVAAGAARPFTRIAVSCIDAPGGTPCGACRQVILEHFAGEAPVIVDGFGTLRADALLPHPFRLDK